MKRYQQNKGKKVIKTLKADQGEQKAKILFMNMFIHLFIHSLTLHQIFFEFLLYTLLSKGLMGEEQWNNGTYVTGDLPSY